jgi:hypothetical protein
MDDIGRECGRPSDSPRWSLLSKAPTSIRAPFENGGVLISPCSHASGLFRSSATLAQSMSDLTSPQAQPNQALARAAA